MPRLRRDSDLPTMSGHTPPDPSSLYIMPMPASAPEPRLDSRDESRSVKLSKGPINAVP